MSEEIVRYGMDRQIAVSPEQMALVKSTIFPDSTDDELKLFCYECERRGVHPLDRLIFPIKRNVGETGQKRVTFQSSIDYLWSVALADSEFDGQDPAEFGPDTNGFPEYATVRIYRKGISRPVIATARWKEYYPGEKMGFMWRKFPHRMLEKCAEVQALRKMFPQKLGGLYAPEEMQRANIVDIEVVTESLSETIQPVAKPNANAEPPKGKEAALTPQEQLKKELAHCPDEEKIAILKKMGRERVSEGEYVSVTGYRNTPLRDAGTKN